MVQVHCKYASLCDTCPSNDRNWLKTRSLGSWACIGREFLKCQTIDTVAPTYPPTFTTVCPEAAQNSVNSVEFRSVQQWHAKSWSCFSNRSCPRTISWRCSKTKHCWAWKQQSCCPPRHTTCLSHKRAECGSLQELIDRFIVKRIGWIVTHLLFVVGRPSLIQTRTLLRP